MKKHYSKKEQSIYNKLVDTHTEFKNITGTYNFAWDEDTVIEMNCVHCGKLHEKELSQLDENFKCSCQIPVYKVKKELKDKREPKPSKANTKKQSKPRKPKTSTLGYIFYMQIKEALREEFPEYNKFASMEIKTEFFLELLKRVKPKIKFSDKQFRKDMKAANGRVDMVRVKYTCTLCGNEYDRMYLHLARTGRCVGCEKKKELSHQDLRERNYAEVRDRIRKELEEKHGEKVGASNPLLNAQFYLDVVKEIHPNYKYDISEFIRNAKTSGTFIEKPITIKCKHQTIVKKYRYWVRCKGCELCQ